MVSPSIGARHTEGEINCRPTSWVDIVKFFLLNYGLHALTVVTEPGSTWVPKTVATILAIFMPSSGMANAFQALTRCAIGGDTDLRTALRAGALCMIVPADPDILVESIRGPFGMKPRVILNPIMPHMTQVHGQYPRMETKIRSTVPGRAKKDKFCLVQVPQNFDVFPLIEERPAAIQEHRRGRSRSAFKRMSKRIIAKVVNVEQSRKLNLACNYSVIKTTAALLQILYGTFELYRALGDQLQRYGYAAYSLTVIPYLLMSIANLFASLSGPQYPSMFLVYFGGTSRQEQSQSTEEHIQMIQKTGRVCASPSEYSSLTELWDRHRAGGAQEIISGAVGVVYGDIVAMGSANSSLRQRLTDSLAAAHSDDNTELRLLDSSVEKPLVNNSLKGGLLGSISVIIRSLFNATRGRSNCSLRLLATSIFSLCLTSAPYVIINLLTGFRSEQSTQSQRIWIICWLVIGQIGATIVSIIEQSGQFILYQWEHPT